MEIKDLISQAGGKAFSLNGSNFDERIITELFSRFVPERQYVENGETVTRSPWSAASEVFNKLKAIEAQNFCAAIDRVLADCYVCGTLRNLCR